MDDKRADGPADSGRHRREAETTEQEWEADRAHEHHDPVDAGDTTGEKWEAEGHRDAVPEVDDETTAGRWEAEGHMEHKPGTTVEGEETTTEHWEAEGHTGRTDS